MSLHPNADEQLPRPTRQSRRPRRTPVARDKTPSPAPAPPPRPVRRRRQPAPPPEPAVDPAEEPAQAPAGHVPDVFDADEPAASSGGAAGPSADSAGEDRDDGEFFPEPPQSTSPSPSPGPASPSRGRQRHSPRAGPHASPPPPPRGRARARGGTKANDVWTFFEHSQGGSKRDCAFCKQRHSANPRASAPKPFASSTSTDAWVEGCDRLKIPITAQDALLRVNEYRARKNQATSGGSTSASDKKRTPFTQDAFVDAIVEWIVSDDQSINVVENEQLRNIFLMLRSELNDSDIPHRTKIRKRVIEIWDEHLANLESEMGIRASSLRRQYFSEVLKALQQKDLQLLRDVDTRWSSTLLMIDRAILLRLAIDKFLDDAQFPDLVKYKLSDAEWEALDIFRRILAVPHAFQQKLSGEKTPTLGNALPAFEAMISQWEKQKAQYPEATHIIQQGIDKLTTYRERVENVPAYILSMLVNPAVKLSWFEKYQPNRVHVVRQLFIRESLLETQYDSE
ncbi:hypothetical protein R3P38DRAFT_2757574 [Favolaschia claudopus]|uniref:Uncharacterized protein n=1 Tax=Favolaschia claudopus TaxID=2862362 RepID=A0AAW0EHR7_9AGAR